MPTVNKTHAATAKAKTAHAAEAKSTKAAEASKKASHAATAKADKFDGKKHEAKGPALHEPNKHVPIGGADLWGAEAANGTGGVKTHLPIDALSSVGKSMGGEVFQLDSDKLGAMELNVRQVVDPSKGPGTEVRFRLTPEASRKLQDAFPKFAGATQAPFLVEQATFADGALQLSAETPYQPVGANYQPLQAQRLEEPGKYQIEYVPPKDNPQAYRDKLRIRVFGATDADRKQNLEAALAKIDGASFIADADGKSAEKLNRLSVLRMVDPKTADSYVADKIDTVTVGQLDKALAAAGVDDKRLSKVKVEEVFPGHMVPVDPALGEQYSKLGVRAVMVGVGQAESVAKILTSDGLMSSLERYGRGIQRQGASMAQDELSGGAEFAFTRLVTDTAISGKADIANSFGAGQVQLVCAGDQMKKLLSRTDWHAYPDDSYGVSIADWQTQPPYADGTSIGQASMRSGKFSERRVLNELVEAVSGTNVGAFQYNNEAMFKNGVPASAFANAIVATDSVKQDLIKQLEAAGVKELGGQPLDKAIVIASDWATAAKKLGLQGAAS